MFRFVDDKIVVVVMDEVDVVVVLILFFDVISLKSLAFNESPH